MMPQITSPGSNCYAQETLTMDLVTWQA